MSLAGKIEQQVRGLFSGWDMVQVKRDECLEQTRVTLTITDQSFHDTKGRYLWKQVHLSSRGTEAVLTKANNGLRFYGRPVKKAGRNRYR